MKRLIVLSIVLFFTNPLYALSGSGTAQDPYRITSMADFNQFVADSNYWNDYIRLDTDINLAGRTFTTAVIAPDTDPSTFNFQGIPFTGVFDGNSHKIMNLTINTATAGNDFLGIFGYISGSTAQVKNLNVENASITSGSDSYYLGCLCGGNDSGTISNCFSSGQVAVGTLSFNIGGLCGYNEDGSMYNCHTSVSISGSYDSGGLCGHIWHGTISNCHANGSVSGIESIGGLCGENFLGTMTDCYATCSVSGTYNLGGLCGSNDTSELSRCHATGQVKSSSTGSSYLGGLCGMNYESTITNCCATGQVVGGTDTSYLGGLCGKNFSGCTISKCYSAGSVSGFQYKGGFCGSNYGSITACFWDTQTSGLTSSDGGTGLTTEQMNIQTVFTDAGWDFNSLWIMTPGKYPQLLPRISGDIDLNGKVDFIDFAQLAANWLKSSN